MSDDIKILILAETVACLKAVTIVIGVDQSRGRWSVRGCVVLNFGA